MPNFHELIEDTEDIDGIKQEVSTDFAVTDLASAEWCLRRVAAAERRMQARHAFVEQRKAQLDAWLNGKKAEKPGEKDIPSANAADLSTTDRMAELLCPWTEHEIAEGGRKSVSLPTGTVGFRQNPDSIDILDSERAVAQIEDWEIDADLIRVKKEINKRDLMAYVKAGGALPEGCELRAGERKFYMKIGE